MPYKDPVVREQYRKDYYESNKKNILIVLMNIIEIIRKKDTEPKLNLDGNNME